MSIGKLGELMESKRWLLITLLCQNVMHQLILYTLLHTGIVYQRDFVVLWGPACNVAVILQCQGAESGGVGFSDLVLGSLCSVALSCYSSHVRMTLMQHCHVILCLCWDHFAMWLVVLFQPCHVRVTLMQHCHIILSLCQDHLAMWLALSSYSDLVMLGWHCSATLSCQSSLVMLGWHCSATLLFCPCVRITQQCGIVLF